MAKRNSIYKSPLRYPGGKGCIFPFMSHFITENDLIGANYAEPYAGGAGLALRLLMDEYVSEIHINDLDPSIYAFWYVVLKNPIDFCEWIKSVPITISSWIYYKEIQRNYKTAPIDDLAKSTFFLNRTNVSGVIKGGVIGGIQQNGKYKIDARFDKEALINKIKIIERFAQRIHLTNMDGTDFIRTINRRNGEYFLYLDPPYYKKGSNLYMNFFNDADHKDLANTITNIGKRYIISYDNNDFIMKLYRNKRKIKYTLSQCASNRTGDEILIFDDKSIFDTSIQHLSNPTMIDTETPH